MKGPKHCCRLQCVMASIYTITSMNHNSLGCEQPYITHRPRCKNESHPMLMYMYVLRHTININKGMDASTVELRIDIIVTVCVGT